MKRGPRGALRQVGLGTVLLLGATLGRRALAEPPRDGASPPIAPRRAILVSFDGAGGLELGRQLPALSPDGFAAAREKGLSAERLVVVTPSLTAVSHASISTGALPNRTGIIANYFHHPGTALLTRWSGFDTESEVETLWEAAARQGKRVLSLTWPGITQQSPRTRTPVGLRFNENRENGSFVRGPSASAQLGEARFVPVGVRSFSPPRSLLVTVPSDGGSPQTLSFLVIDATDDGRVDYRQLVALAPDGSVRAKVAVGEWFSLTESRAEDQGDPDVVVGRWIKLLTLAPDLSAISLYLGPENRSYARPDDFRRSLDRHAGFWPGPPDAGFLLQPEPDVASFVEQVDRFTRYFVSAFEVARRRGDWDLLLAYQPIVDEAEHALTLTDPRQKPYTAERAKRCAAALRDVWRMADRAAAAYLKFQEDGDVFLVSDHGMRTITKAMNVLEAMRRQGWVKTTTEGGRLTVAPDSPADATTGGGIAHIRLNRLGRLPGGVLTGAQAERILSDMAAYFRALTDEETGERVFSVVVRNEEAGPLGLDHPNAGDLILISKGSITVRAFLRKGGEKGSMFVEAENIGQHGFEPDPELDGIFFHVGEGVVPERVPSFRAIDVAARVAARLGIDPPGGARSSTPAPVRDHQH